MHCRCGFDNMNIDWEAIDSLTYDYDHCNNCGTCPIKRWFSYKLNLDAVAKIYDAIIEKEQIRTNEIMDSFLKQF